MDHTTFRETLESAIVTARTREGELARFDADYMSDALDASRGFTIDALTVADALDIASEY